MECCIDKFMTSWKSDLSDNIKWEFSLFVAMSVLLYGCTNRILTKYPEKKKLDSNYTRLLFAVLNKSWKEYPTKQQLHGHLPPIS